MKATSHRILCLCAALVLTLSLGACHRAKQSPSPSEPAATATADQTTAVPLTATEAAINSDPSQNAAAASESTDESVITYSESTTTPKAIDADALLSSGRSNPDDPYDATGFVLVSDLIPDIEQEIRYYSDYNFVGERISGYNEPVAILTKEAAVALLDAQEDLKEQGYRLKIYDAYRPQSAVDHFASWAADYTDTRMQSEFYPELDKSVLYGYGYIAYQSGHSRGSTVDVTLVDADTGEDVDMGGAFDYFGQKSHPDYTGVTSEQYNNRMILRNAMTNNGFSPLSTEWWHFSYNNEPYPYTYFNFPVSSSSVKGSY